MEKFSFAVLLLLAIRVSDYFGMGQSTIGEWNNDEQNKHNSDTLFAIRSEIQNLKGQISRMENCVERSQKVYG